MGLFSRSWKKDIPSPPDAKRPPNKLSKPRTNSSSNLLATGNTPNTSQQTLISNVSDFPRPGNKRRSTATVLDMPPVVEKYVDERKEEKRPKSSRRISLFRSKSAKPEGRKPLPVTDESLPVVNLQEEMPSQRYFENAPRSQELATGAAYGTNELRGESYLERRMSGYVATTREQAALSVIYSEVTGSEVGPQRRTSYRELPVDEASFLGNSSIDDSMTIPMRRRSLMTPGIATRKSSFSHDADTSRHSSIYHHEMPASSSYYTIPASQDNIPVRAKTVGSGAELQNHYQNTKTVRSQSVAAADATSADLRAETPCEMNYSHIGTHKFGSLRIANGDVSPKSIHDVNHHIDEVDKSAASKIRDSELALDDTDQSDGEVTYRKTFDPTTGEFRKHKERKSDGVVQVQRPQAPGYSEGELTYRRRFDVTTGGFIHYKESRDTLENQYVEAGNESGLLYTSEPEELVPKTPPMGGGSHPLGSHINLKTALNLQNDEQSLFSLGAIGSIHRKFDRHSPTRSRDMARAYMSEIPTSPFSFEESSSSPAMFETISKDTALEKQLISSAPMNRLSITLDPMSLQPLADEKSQAVQGSQIDAAMAKPTSTKLRQLSKADSGYSSTSSLRRMRSKSSPERQTTPGPEVPEKNAQPALPKNTYVGAQPELLKRQTISQKYSWTKKDDGPCLSQHNDNVVESNPAELEATKTLVLLNQQPWRSVPLVPVDADDTIGAHTQVEAISAFKPLPSDAQQVLLNGNGVSRHKHTDSSSSDISSSSKRSRLLKSRSNAQPAEVTVQCIRDVSPSTVPTPSAEAFARLEKRIASFPPLEHTYKTVHKTNSRDTLATMSTFVIDGAPSIDAEAQAGEVEYPRRKDSLPISQKTVVDSDNVESPAKRKMSPQPARKSIDSTNSKRSSLVITRKPVHTEAERKEKAEKRKSWLKEKNQEAFETHITSFGTVSQSLGASPYDLAMGTIARPRPSQPLAQSAPSSTAPHSISNAGWSQGVTRGMNSAAATQFARQRSEMRKQELHRMSLDMPSSTYAQPTFNERGEALRWQMRPSSLVFGAEEVPPVPALPLNLAPDQRLGNLRRKSKSPPVSLPVHLKKTTPGPPYTGHAGSTQNFVEPNWDHQQKPWPRRKDSVNRRVSRRGSDSDAQAERLGNGQSSDVPFSSHGTTIDPRSFLPSQRRSSDTWQPIPDPTYNHQQVPYSQYQHYLYQQDVPQHHQQHQPQYRILHSEQRSQAAAARQRMSLPVQPHQMPIRSQTTHQMHDNQRSLNHERPQSHSYSRPQSHAQLRPHTSSSSYQRRGQSGLGFGTGVKAATGNENMNAREDFQNTGLSRKTSLLSRNSYDDLSYSGPHPKLERRSTSHGNGFQEKPPPKQNMTQHNQRRTPAQDTYNNFDYGEHAYTTSTQEQHEKGDDLVLDRYSGGLGMGFGGESDGADAQERCMRFASEEHGQSGGNHTRKKSIDRTWGVDWVDVPIMDSSMRNRGGGIEV